MCGERERALFLCLQGLRELLFSVFHIRSDSSFAGGFWFSRLPFTALNLSTTFFAGPFIFHVLCQDPLLLRVMTRPRCLMDFSCSRSLLPGHDTSQCCWISRSAGAGDYKEKTADKSHWGEQELGHPERNVTLFLQSRWVRWRRISHFHVKSSEDERWRGGRSKSQSLYPTSMINVQEYASEALEQGGWHLTEFPSTCVWRRRNVIHEEQQTGLQVYSRVRERGEGREINKMSGNLQVTHRGRERGFRGRSFASTGCFFSALFPFFQASGQVTALLRWTCHRCLLSALV